MTYIPPNTNGQATSANSSPVVIASDQSNIPVASAFQPQAFTFSSVTTGTTFDLGNYRWISVQVNAYYTGTTPTVNFQGSNDNTNWFSIALAPSSSFSAAVNNTTTTGIWSGAAPARYFRLTTTGTYTSGSTTGQMLFSTLPSAFNTVAAAQAGTWTIGAGAAAIGTVQVGNTPNTTAILANPLTPAVSTTGDTGAKTATFNGATQTNTTAKGAQIVLNIGVVSGTTPTLVAALQGSADGGTTWFNIPNATTASLVATGVWGMMIYPGLPVLAGTTTSLSTAQVNAALPRTWRVVYTIGGTTPSFTITNVQVNYLI